MIDFGIARTLDMSLTKTGEVAGTPSYMAPEVFTGRRAGPARRRVRVGAVFAATGLESPVDPGEVAAVVCRRADRTLSAAERDAVFKDVPYCDVCPQ